MPQNLNIEHLTIAAHLLIAALAASHALLTKRDPRSAWGWIAVCWLFPLAGAALYFVFGINRIYTRARRSVGATPALTPTQLRELPAPLQRGAGGDNERLVELLRIGQAMTGREMTFGNRIEPLYNGEQAYPAMLAAIASARYSIDFVTYIYRRGVIGKQFAAALSYAQGRGVEVRILLDGVTDLYYLPRTSLLLTEHDLKPRLFLPLRFLPPMLHINLRNHRKLLLVDEKVAFTGGMNIADHHLMQRPKGTRVQDLHFRIEGPAVQQMMQVFAEDWRFVTGEKSPPPRAVSVPTGSAAARVITDGPNEDLDKLLMVLLGALAAAHHRVWIMTPYFIPNPQLIAALQSAALRGVDVSIILPAKSDQPWLNWAAHNYLGPLLQRHVRVYMQPPPFAHTKLFLVDDRYMQVGSANLDNRSLRLNFELVVEAIDARLVENLAAHFARVRSSSREVSLAEIERRSLPARFRDSVFWLFSPYL
ncbi:MAG: cardiolipin synthetase 2 [Nevskia sp.]|nr:cardiolipin synthetase 2 [Nevskia sp.]